MWQGGGIFMLCLIASLITRENLSLELVAMLSLTTALMSLWLGISNKCNAEETDLEFLAQLIQRQAAVITKQAVRTSTEYIILFLYI